MFSKTILSLFTYALLFYMLIEDVEGNKKRLSENQDYPEPEGGEDYNVDGKPVKQKISLPSFDEESEDYSNRDRLDGKVLKFPSRSKDGKDEHRTQLKLPKRLKHKKMEDTSPKPKVALKTLEDPSSFNRDLDPRNDELNFDNIDLQDFAKIRKLICSDDFAKSRRFSNNETVPVNTTVNKRPRNLPFKLEIKDSNQTRYSDGKKLRRQLATEKMLYGMNIANFTNSSAVDEYEKFVLKHAILLDSSLGKAWTFEIMCSLLIVSILFSMW